MACCCLGYSFGRTNSIRVGEAERRALFRVGMVECDGYLDGGRGGDAIGIVAARVGLGSAALEPPGGSLPLSLLGGFSDVGHVADLSVGLSFFHSLRKFRKALEPDAERLS